MKNDSLKGWFNSGSPGVWLSGGAVSIAVIMTVGLLALLAVRGLGHFWPANLVHATYEVPGQPAKVLIGEVVQKEEVPRAQLAGAGLPVPAQGPEFMTRELIKVGNRDIGGMDFVWVVGDWLREQSKPLELVTIERREWGNFYGYLVNIKENGQVVAEGDAVFDQLYPRIDRVKDLDRQLKRLEKGEIGSINAQLERIRLHSRKLELEHRLDATAQADMDAERAALKGQYLDIESRLGDLHQAINRDSLTVRDINGKVMEISMGKVLHAYQPNAMGLFKKLGFYFGKVGEFLSQDPREANTEGGVFPAIFGTVMMTLIMAMIVTPFGVLAAVYLREYARQGPMTRLIRIAVNNLAGVPAIVYGVFGLGFFVYVLGGSLDRLFFPEALPAPTFGTPGPAVGIADPGAAGGAGGDRGHRGRPGAHPVEPARGLAGLGRDQGRDPVENRSAHGQPGHDDRHDPGRGPRRRRGGPADAGGCGEDGTVVAGGRQLPVPAPGPEDHAPGLPYL
ncbi:phosphate transport system permease protein [Pseudomonas sp. TE3610]